MRNLVLLPLAFGCSVVHIDADTALPVATPTEPTDTAVPLGPPFAVCVDQTPATSAPVPDFTADVAPLFKVCVTCHTDNPTGLEFLDPHAELVGVPSAQLASMNRVTPGDLRASYLWHKLCNTHEEVGGSGNAMPIQRSIDEAQAVTIAAWILSGAAD